MALKLQIAAGLLLACFFQQLPASEQDRDYLAQLEQARRKWNTAALSNCR
jgi:hypothetical protein